MSVKSTVAVLGTIRELHKESIAYDFRRLADLIAWLHGLLIRSQRWAGGPRAINSHLFGAVCMTLCGLAVFLAGREVRRAWRDKNRRLVANVLACIRRDPGASFFFPPL